MIVCTQYIAAQTPFIRNFSPIEYKASTQNWAVVEDTRGFFYFGNTNGVLEYDGMDWYLIETPSTVRSLAISTNGRIYVGLVGDFGYLEANQKGILQYTSLKNTIPKEHLDFNEVWFIHILNDRIFFTAFEKIFVLQSDSIEVVLPDNRFHTSFVVNDRLYVREWGKGLQHYDQEGLHLIPGGEIFSQERIYVMLPFEKDKILIGTRTQGLYLYSPNDENPFSKPVGVEEIEIFLEKNLLYRGIQLNEEEYAISTVNGGVLVFNKKGQVTHRYNENNGLKDNSVWGLHISERHKAIWLVTNNGIGSIHRELPFDYFKSEDGVEGTIHAVTTFEDKTYLSTSQSVFKLKNKRIERLDASTGQYWGIQQVKKGLLVGKSPGNFLIKRIT